MLTPEKSWPAHTLRLCHPGCGQQCACQKAIAGQRFEVCGAAAQIIQVKCCALCVGDEEGGDGAAGGAIGLRPENVLLRPSGQGAIAGQVDLVEALGAETLVYVSTTGGASLVARLSERTDLAAGQPVTLDVATEHAHWFDPSGRVVRQTPRFDSV